MFLAGICSLVVTECGPACSATLKRMSRRRLPLARVPRAASTFVLPRVFTARTPDAAVREAAASPAHRAGLWETSIDSALQERLNDLAGSPQASTLHGAVIARGNQLVAEHYGNGDDQRYGQRLRAVAFTPHTLHDIRSVTKSVTGLLYGIALERGEVPGPDSLLVDSFPDFRMNMVRAGLTDLTMHHVLSMTMGARWSEQGSYRDANNDEIGMELASDRYRYVLSRERIEPAGVAWRYSGGASALLGALVERGTGLTLARNARERLFGPLGIDHWQWMAGSDRRPSAASGLRLTARDLARIGRLLLNGGQWDGQQVVPKSWILLAGSRHTGPTWSEDIDYGYQWYVTAGDSHPRWVGGIGNGGQSVMALPELDLSVAVLAGGYDSADQGREARAILADVIGG